MKWMKYSLKTTTQAEDAIINLLGELGIDAVEIEDHISITEEERKSMFIDFLPDIGPDDGIATIHFYVEFDETKNLDEFQMKSQQLLMKLQDGLDTIKNYLPIGEATISQSETEDKDWINNWKQFWKPMRVEESIIIKPTWETYEKEKEDDLIIEIDPGTAFGTGSHETTKLCIQAMRRYVTAGCELLDVGCGSGILSIIGLKLGAHHAVGVDIDPVAITASEENASYNQITKEQFAIYAGNLIEDETLQQEVGIAKYDVVLANILADVIIPLSSEISQHMKPGAVFITSGIIDMKKDEVVEAVTKNGFEILEINQMGDWFSVICRWN